MDRCALFVDAGYVLADGAMAVHGTRRGESVSWDYEGLLQLLSSLARERSGLPLLRCYWYETSADGRRLAEHDALADLPGIKFRLAKVRPGRREGVETEIQRDLTTLARNNAISDALVVSAEEDLAQVIADVQDLGMRVTLVHIAVDGNWTISRTLRQEADDLIEIGGEHLRPYVELIAGAEPVLEEPDLAIRSNGHLAGVGAYQQSSTPPAIYTAPVVAEYQRPALQLPRASAREASVRETREPRETVTREPALRETPVREAPVREAPVREATVREATARETTVREAPVRESPVRETSARETSVREAPVREAPARETSARESSVRELPARDLPARDLPARDLPARESLPREDRVREDRVDRPREDRVREDRPREERVREDRPTIADPQTAEPLPAPSAQLRRLPSRGQARETRDARDLAPAPHTPGQHSTAQQHSGPQHGQGSAASRSAPYSGPQQVLPSTYSPQPAVSLADAVQAAHEEGQDFGESVARDAPALWLEAVLARKPRMPSDLEARLLQGSALPIDFLLHDEVRHALRRGFWDALERTRR
ncbi:MAG TPA: NYN domain-containing protein [Streptosporangiaceae bacterium]|nr:NYN domain-containing protein [Streptosporangiaceae bacterium]